MAFTVIITVIITFIINVSILVPILEVRKRKPKVSFTSDPTN